MAGPTPDSGQQRSGKLSTMSVSDGGGGSIPLNVKEANVTEQADDLDTTNFEAIGYETGLPGIQVAVFDVRADWDAGRNFYSSPPGIYPRSDLEDVSFTESTLDNDAWEISLARILSSKNSMPVRGLVGFDFNGKSNGEYTNASGSMQPAR